MHFDRAAFGPRQGKKRRQYRVLARLFNAVLVQKPPSKSGSYSFSFTKGENIGNYYADYCVENKVIIELKSVETLSMAHETQLLNYLKATEIEIGLLMNFGEKPQLKRRIFSNKRK